MGGARLLTHLVFADVILLFSRAIVKLVKAFRSIVDNFAIFSNLVVNNQKSSLIFSKSMQHRQELLGILRFVEGSLSFQYLGVSIVVKEL